MPEPIPEPPAPIIAPPGSGTEEPPEEVVRAPESVFDALSFWYDADARPALEAFRRSCTVWKKSDANRVLHKDHPQYGRVADWLPACTSADTVTDNRDSARAFFEREFLPVHFETNPTGLLTAYYRPEIQVTKTPTREFREPVLATPEDESIKNRPRKDITPNGTRVIAFGRPADVFFMQIQGSGILVFPDGARLGASYADNNGYKYESIGKILIRRGELKQVSLQSIKTWMKEAGPVKSRALMNENPRYIYFSDHPVVSGEEGPKGAASIPLTAMGSLAVDPQHYPYGLPIWIEVSIPQEEGDYEGKPEGLLLIAQDTGDAIRGVFRGDIYFGSGDEAGARAGVMKHHGQWTLLLPVALTRRVSPPV
ncbi:MAG: MltA domain-containing protein [Hyphomonadaceae bacterium]|nr:MltA domain-containing protein [Hyphomonadaceae bacterium]